MPFARTSARAALRQARRQPFNGARFNSTKSTLSEAAPSAQSGASHLASGFAGGLAVLGLGYGYYHYSGLAGYVNTAKETAATFQSAKDKVVEKAPSPRAALKLLRTAAQSYAGVIPGAKGVVDGVFDKVDELSEKHGEEVDKIVTETYGELKKLYAKGVSEDTASQAFELIQEKLSQIYELAGEAGQDVFGPLLKEHPELKAGVEGGLSQLRSLSEKAGPEAKKIVDETYSELKDLVGKGVTPASIASAVALIARQVSKAKELAPDALDADKLWQQAQEKAKPYLEKVPDLKKLLDDNAETIKAVGGPDAEKLVQEIYAKAEEISKKGLNKDSISDLQSFITERASTASSIASKAGTNALSQAKELYKQVPDIAELQKLGKEHGPEVKKIVEEGWGEVKEVLKKKVEEARKVAEKAQKDVKEKK
ncbi:hypothetical protein G7K_1750-t1 [Saitoella complicata NRRL Y-17804]|uniref:Uncharacterized protein n=1 Tax=Saitoella complicata (strain BCRC 22490 / CBS 7301 / JCM 7358 / NBRC 10748 / NRRL Y-17804) TaxID=698492 RepID=A0A0E9NDR2_SAICN|nr:hypothetical protein G7K_1750-t1 [Saitoella complicata NRRL Y-17804]